MNTFHLLPVSFISLQLDCVFYNESVCFIKSVSIQTSERYVFFMYVIMIVCTCVDLDECVEGQHQCQQRCINTFGSYKCSCDDGYQPAHDQTSCTGVCMAVWLRPFIHLCLFMSFTSMNKVYSPSSQMWMSACCLQL